jgi:hypothetical protein
MTQNLPGLTCEIHKNFANVVGLSNSQRIENFVESEPFNTEKLLRACAKPRNCLIKFLYGFIFLTFKE